MNASRFQSSAEGKKYPHIDKTRVTYVIEEVGYWRKANAIHMWFVENVQSNVDDCGEYEVSEEKLKTLLGLCLDVKANPELAPDLLPSQSGFFFGSTDYGEYYFEDIETTIVIIEECLRVDNGGSWFTYNSSW